MKFGDLFFLNAGWTRSTELDFFVKGRHLGRFAIESVLSDFYNAEVFFFSQDKVLFSSEVIAHDENN